MQRSPLPELRKSSGAFDLPSIITGVVVVGILTAGVLAAIFGVIPYAQNNGAKQDLSAIRTAEGVAKAKDNRFMNHQGLLDIGYLQDSSTKQTKVMADEKGTCYVALAKSGTGKIFVATDRNTDPEIFDPGTDYGCLTKEQLAELVESVGGIEDEGQAGGGIGDGGSTPGSPELPDGTGQEGKLGLQVIPRSSLFAVATWNTPKNPPIYTLEYRINGGPWQVRPNTSSGVSLHSLEMSAELEVRLYEGMPNSGGAAETVSVQLPDGVLKNPGFEEGAQHWVFNSATVVSGAGRGGSAAGKVDKSYGSIWQMVTIPAERPVLSYWVSGAQRCPSVDWTSNTSTYVQPGDNVDGWLNCKIDLSALAGTNRNIEILNSAPHDDFDLEFASEPNSPTNVRAFTKDNTAIVYWNPTRFAGGSPLTSYTVTAWADGEAVSTLKVAPGLAQGTVPGLAPGVDYNMTVTADNAVGSSAPAEAPMAIPGNAGAVGNPGFELGLTGWLYGSGAVLETGGIARSGSNSISLGYSSTVSQSVITPADRTVLSLWSTGTPRVEFGSKRIPLVAGETVDGWTRYTGDASSLVGVTGLIYIKGPGYVDDIAFVAK
ncbi:fibronectin type III domain-containing protein [Arthrobacter sp. IK3]|uniref:fibronectin type III domain-containing protein n=1 Tax=Arthrobacter sp. IK3 TaxID=3448169 RepID=UPI003EE05D7E